MPSRILMPSTKLGALGAGPGAWMVAFLAVLVSVLMGAGVPGAALPVCVRPATIMPPSVCVGLCEQCSSIACGYVPPLRHRHHAGCLLSISGVLMCRATRPLLTGSCWPHMLGHHMRCTMQTAR